MGRLKLNYIKVKKKLTLLETVFGQHRVYPQMQINMTLHDE